MKRVLLTGGNGFLGNHVYNSLNGNYDLIRFSSNEIDLTDKSKTIQFFKDVKPDIVVNMAARLGGIGDNIKNPLAYYETNLSIGLNVLKASALAGVSHMINVGTVCSYPKFPSLPFLETDLWNGLPEESNRYYGLSKRAVIDYGMVLSDSGKLNTTNLLMANLYGIGDDFREKTSHVIPALIKKVHNLKEDEHLEVWGDGTPSRDFLNVEDAARIIKQVVDTGFKETFPINVGTGKERTINEIVSIILNYYGKSDLDVRHIKSKPNGQPRRVLNVERLERLYSIKSDIDLEEGIRDIINWYKNESSALSQLGDKYAE